MRFNVTFVDKNRNKLYQNAIVANNDIQAVKKMLCGLSYFEVKKFTKLNHINDWLDRKDCSVRVRLC